MIPQTANFASRSILGGNKGIKGSGVNGCFGLTFAVCHGNSLGKVKSRNHQLDISCLFTQPGFTTPRLPLNFTLLLTSNSVCGIIIMQCLMAEFRPKSSPIQWPFFISMSKQPDIPPQEPILPNLRSPEELRGMSLEQLERLATEIRAELCRLADHRAVHFASNLGVVELTIALHASFDFSHDRLLWDTGHQSYPHKLLTGRFERFQSMRQKGGLMGFPNPNESPYDLMMTGHTGTSVGAITGFTVADELLEGPNSRHSIAVIGDGALSSGLVFEALNHAGGMRKNLTVILNDNEMSICPRVGGLSHYLDQLRMAPTYLGFKTGIQRFVRHMPFFGASTHRIFAQFKQAVKAGLLGGMLFEEFGFRYIGPIDGHDIARMRKFLPKLAKYKEPVLLHVFTEKGRGYTPAEEDPTTYHAPSPNVKKNGKNGKGDNSIKILERIGLENVDSSETAKDGDCERNEPASYTHWMAAAIHRQIEENPKACIITAAMCQGNMLESVRNDFPDRFFDVGICESHALVFAAGLSRAGMRPIVDIYSTFLQRGYDQLFHEVSLQNLPIVLAIDRAGLSGPDGPTHHGVFDLAYLRPFPNFVLMAPGEGRETMEMLDFAMRYDGPSAIRYPKSIAPHLPGPNRPIKLGKAEILKSGTDGMIAVYGGLLDTALNAADETGFGVINARFLKPLDTETLLAPLREGKRLFTLEESMRAGGFGSAILEAASDEGIDTRLIERIGIPDRYIEHGDRSELLADLGMDADSIRKRLI